MERLDEGRQQSWAAEGSEVAYIIYTSGSTGRAKGVCVPHRAVNRLVVNCDYVQLGPEEVVAQISNCCFDAATFEIWGALLNGSRLVGIERERVLSAETFSTELARHGVTTLFVTTALFNELVRERSEIFGQVRNVLFGGEEADPGAVRKVLESGGPPQRLLNVYGPTETTTFATWYEIPAGQNCAGRIPIGRPIANTEIYILDPHLNPVPVGVPGEIWIGGEGVANGYLNQPELTEERFIASPFVSGAEALPHGRPGPISARWQYRVPGPARRPGQDPGLSHRVGRDRMPIAPAPQRRRSDCHRAAGQPWRQAARRLCGRHRHAARSQRTAGISW